MLARGALVAILSALFLLGCRRESGNKPQPSAPSASRATPPGSSKGPAPSVAPATLLSTSGSAYAASLFVEDEAVYLLTSDAAYRLGSGRAPERWALPLGIAPALTTEHIVYWSDGAVRRVPKRGGDSALLAKVPRTPQRLAAHGDHLAWLAQADDGRFSLNTLDGSQPRVVLEPAFQVAALSMIHDQVFFVEQTPGSTWRLGVVPLAGGAPRYTADQRGRTPSMLAVAGDAFYYDGPTLTIHRVSPDLERDEVIAKGVICSPIAVSTKVYCAQPGGLLEVPLEGGPARVLPRGRRGTIAAVAASRSTLAWVLDVGENALAVESLPVSSALAP